MRRPAGILALVTELLIVVGLIWRHASLFDLHAPFLLLLVSPVLAVCHWKLLASQRLSPLTSFALFFLTAPTAILSLSLILAVTLQLRSVGLLHGPPKEMIPAVKHISKDCVPQWTKDFVARLKSERLLYLMVLTSSCLLYASRISMTDQVTSNSLDGSGLSGHPFRGARPT